MKKKVLIQVHTSFLQTDGCLDARYFCAALWISLQHLLTRRLVKELPCRTIVGLITSATRVIATSGGEHQFGDPKLSRWLAMDLTTILVIAANFGS